jgi:hypothetical protein
LLERLSVDQESIAGIVVIILVAAAIILALSVFITFLSLSKNVYVALYETSGVVLDTSGVGVDTAFSSIVSPGLANSYPVLSVLIAGGIFRIIVIGLVIGIFMNSLTGMRIRDKLGVLSIRGTKGHVIICGYSELGAKIAEQLGVKKKKTVIIEKDYAKADLLKDMDYKTIRGDFTSEETLKAALIGKASAIIFATEDDFVNLMGILAAKKLNAKIKVISAAKEQSSTSKMYRAGATMCVIPEILAGMEMGNSLSGSVM